MGRCVPWFPSMAHDLAARNFIVTGANTGIGRITAIELARRGAHVILACRSKDKTLPVLEQIKRETGNPGVEFVALDLADLGSVRACAGALSARNLPLHGLINNAGIAGHRGQTRDGFELAFGTNHIGHYVMTRLLLDRLKQAGSARIVNVSSSSHYRATGIDWDAVRQPTRTVTGFPEYAVSKLANILFTKELARRLDGTGVTTYAVDPGRVATDVWRRVPAPVRWAIKKFMLSPEQGAQSSLVAAASPDVAADTGRYYTVGGTPQRPSPLAEDAELAKTLWTKSAAWTGLED